LALALQEKPCRCSVVFLSSTSKMCGVGTLCARVRLSAMYHRAIHRCPQPTSITTITDAHSRTRGNEKETASESRRDNCQPDERWGEEKRRVAEGKLEIRSAERYGRVAEEMKNISAYKEVISLKWNGARWILPRRWRDEIAIREKNTGDSWKVRMPVRKSVQRLMQT